MGKFNWSEGTTKEFSDAIKVYKAYQPEDQVKNFSELVISTIDKKRLDLLEVLLKTVKNNDTFDYLNTERAYGDVPLSYICTKQNLLDDSQYSFISQLVSSPSLKGNIYKFIKLLLDKGADPNVLNKQGNTPLHEACSAGRDDIVELLLKHKANPNMLNTQGEAPLSCVFKAEDKKGKAGIIKLLLRYGADLNIDQEGKLLFYFVNEYTGDDLYEIVELFLDKGVDPNIQDSQGKTPLHYLCDKHRSDVKIAKLLLRRSANPDLKDKNGKKPVDYAQHSSDIGKLFGVANPEKIVLPMGFASSTGFLALNFAVPALYTGVSIGVCTEFLCYAAIAAIFAVAFCCACYAIKIMSSPKPSSEFIEAITKRVDELGARNSSQDCGNALT